MHFAGKVRRRKGDRRTNLLRVAFEPVIRDHQERGAIVHAGFVNRGHHLFHAAIQKRDGAGRGQALGAELMVHRIEREEVQQHQVGPVFADQIDRRPGPDLVAKQDVRLREILHVGGGDRALADHLLLHRARPGVAHSLNGQVMVGALLMATQSICAVVSPALWAAS